MGATSESQNVFSNLFGHIAIIVHCGDIGALGPGESNTLNDVTNVNGRRRDI